jgi:hypothetical protein
MELPLREQGTLLTVVRGCDLTPKLPLDSNARRLVSCLRYTFLNPADEREVDSEPGTFMSRKLPPSFKTSEFGHLPWHWLSHVMHAVEVIGYRHPDHTIRTTYHALYNRMAHSFHLNPESFEQFAARMSEDRIATGEIVS